MPLSFLTSPEESQFSQSHCFVCQVLQVLNHQVSSLDSLQCIHVSCTGEQRTGDNIRNVFSWVMSGEGPSRLTCPYLLSLSYKYERLWLWTDIIFHWQIHDDYSQSHFCPFYVWKCFPTGFSAPTSEELQHFFLM